MRQLLIDKPEGLGFYPFISTKSDGGILCMNEKQNNEGSYEGNDNDA